MPFFSDIVIGLSTGVVSSLIVSWLWQKRTENILSRSEYYKETNRDIEYLCYFLRQIKTECKIVVHDGKTDELVRLIDRRPFTLTFKYAAVDDFSELLKKIQITIKKIQNVALKRKLNENEANKYCQEIQAFELQIIRNKADYIKPWVKGIERHKQ